MPKVHASIACNLDLDLLRASLPLFNAEKVSAIEWSFDTLFRVGQIPAWFTELLFAYSQADRLIGHGVFFSLFAGRWSVEQEGWLKHLQKVSRHFNFQHITEHFGFMTGANFHEGAPISIPFTPQTLATGRDRLQRIQQACGCPVGLENLAFAYSLEEVERHGAFLAELVAPVDGFIILDLHNLYCQLHNFDQSFEHLIEKYPLHLVREIHISGGSWEQSEQMPDQSIRRDTHDGGVPEAVFAILSRVLPRCPNLRFVVLEQMGTALKTPAEQSTFQEDFLRMEALVDRHNQSSIDTLLHDFLPKTFPPLQEPVEEENLYLQQRALAHILENAKNYQEAKDRLATSVLANTAWQVEQWAPHMLETVIKIAQKWKAENGI